jgi:hypothetical protein
VSQYYRIELDQPKTSTRAAQTWKFTPEGDVIISVDVDLRKEDRHISLATIRIRDPRANGQMWPMCNAFPDPAFQDIPVRVYLAKPGESQAASKLIFDGKVTSLQPGWPAPSQVTVVAHDRSIDLRLQAKYRTIKNKTSVALAQQIASDYGYTVDVSQLGSIVLTQRLVDMGFGGVGRGTFSDWNHIARALAVDGLELYVKGKVIAIRRLAQTAYPRTFRPDDGFVTEFQPTVNHVSSPGAGGQTKAPQPGGTKGTALATTGVNKSETDAEKADATTHRKHPQGPASTSKGAHTESTGDNSGPASQRRKRKDEASLTLYALPDLGLQHRIVMGGWGQKFDGNWHVVDMRFQIAGNGPTMQHLRLSREPQGGALKQAGVAAPGGTST